VVIPALVFGLIFLTVFSFILWYSNYRKYYEYLQLNHNKEFIRLIKKDRVIDAVGEWIRWPVGSAWLLLSIFKIDENYGDKKILIFKKRALHFFLIFLILFFSSFSLALIL
jgi:hypothetical protein